MCLPRAVLTDLVTCQCGRCWQPSSPRLDRLVVLATPPDTPNRLLVTGGRGGNWRSIPACHDRSNGAPSLRRPATPGLRLVIDSSWGEAPKLPASAVGSMTAMFGLPRKGQTGGLGR